MAHDTKFHVTTLVPTVMKYIHEFLVR